MKGYIGIANDDWCNCLQSTKSSHAVFWRKKASFKALQKGEIFYFLNRKNVEGKRFVVGRGKYCDWHIMPAKKAWAEYGGTLGYREEKEFLDSLRSIYKTDEVELGCVLLQEVVFFDKPVCLSECNIDFSPYIVSGKTIGEEECIRLNYVLERRT
ncbi:hypothetical protein [Stomatobaculum longum]|uniref:hypothetical protein n=1 Tax=Stomatobaculum longum TaxID=796942 RepID=UPI0028052CEC|nr:hypothetical protein [Stomatobaculum longum]